MYKLNMLLGVIVLFIINGCGGNNSTSNDNLDSNLSTITHNGTTYTLVTSPYTGRVWLDRNLGAARACESFNDTACYGDYYQWGRNFDGHQDSSSATTTKQTTDLNNTGDEFILDNGQHRDDWVNNDKSGEIRMQIISSYDGSYICPKGFRVPTVGEFLAETSQASDAVENNMDAYKSFLKLPSSGLRIGSTGKMRIDNTDAFYMVSGGNYSYGVDYFFYADKEVGKGSLGARVNGQTIRCIQN